MNKLLKICAAIAIVAMLSGCYASAGVSIPKGQTGGSVSIG